jgi:phosphoadenosine phosphosulfate reductase
VKPSRTQRRAEKLVQAAMLAAKRIASAKARLALAAETSKSCVVALSGGKDSLVTLDLVCEVFERVEAFYLYLVPGLRTFEAPVEAAARRHNITVQKLPHFDLPRLIKYAVLRPHVPNAASIRELRWSDINKTVREQTGIQWIATGERASDSLQRRFYTRVHDGVQPEHNRIFPIWDWCDADVFGYLRARGIQVPSYGDYAAPRGSGFSLDGRGLSWLKRAHREDYNRVLKVFPYAEAEVIRFDSGGSTRRQRAERVPKVRAATRAPAGAEERALQPAPEAQPAQTDKA